MCIKAVYSRNVLGLIFGTILQQDMDNFVDDWNMHLIRPSRNDNSPSGRPCDMYDMPSLFGMLQAFLNNRTFYCVLLLSGKQDQLMNIDCDLWTKCMLEYSKKPPPLCPTHLAEDIEYFLHTLLGMSLADLTHDNCRDVYLFLTTFIESLM